MRRSALALALILFALAALAPACTVGSRPTPGGDDAFVPFPDAGRDAAPFACPHMATVACDTNHAITCAADGTQVGTPLDCATHGGMCVNGTGCVACIPDTRHCDASGASVACLPDGSGLAAPQVCDASRGETCNASTGRCSSPCLDAETTLSYVGCDYWPTPTINTELHRDLFEFAVAVANPNTTPVTATITRGATVLEMRTVAPGALETIVLPWIDALEGGGDATSSALVADGAYHLTTDAPVTAYEFNALEYENDSAGFPQYSFSNDASLLLPSHVLTGHYYVISRPTNYVERVLHHPTEGDIPSTELSPGFVAIVGIDAHATVAVDFTANVLASMDGVAVRAFRAGDTGHFTLDRGQVLQLLTDHPPTCNRIAMETQTFMTTPVITQDDYYCEVGPDYDLTGTRITAVGHVEVIGGHNCDFVPFDRWACDHLEQVLFPLETWGHEAIFSVSQPLRDEPNLARILSGADGNTITFEPASVHAPVTLDAGEYLEIEVRDHFRASGTAAFQIAQFMVGQDYAGVGTSGMDADGDPSMSLVIPSAQYRTEYTFLAPTTYAQSYVNVTVPDGVEVVLDGSPIDPRATGGWMPVGTTGTSVARIPIDGGSHEIHAAMPFGIVVYGFGRYTSYMYPGGLDLMPINPVI